MAQTFTDFVAYSVNSYGYNQLHDVVNEAIMFEKEALTEENNKMQWHHSWWGYMMFPKIKVENNQTEV